MMSDALFRPTLGRYPGGRSSLRQTKGNDWARGIPGNAYLRSNDACLNADQHQRDNRENIALAEPVFKFKEGRGQPKSMKRWGGGEGRPTYTATEMTRNSRVLAEGILTILSRSNKVIPETI